MAKTRSNSEIYYDYNQARSQANQLREIARQMRQVAKNDYENVIQETNAKWQGDSSDAFKNKLVKVKSEVEQTANRLDRAADRITATAKRLYNAEMQAKRIAEQRNH